MAKPDGGDSDFTVWSMCHHITKTMCEEEWLHSELENSPKKIHAIGTELAWDVHVDVIKENLHFDDQSKQAVFLFFRRGVFLKK